MAASTPADLAGSYFERTGPTTFEPTHRTSGAWRETEQHFSPLGGLLVHAIELDAAERRGEEVLPIAQVAFDILGVVELEPMEVTVEVVRPGRTIELVEATLTWRGRAVVRARAWCMAETDTGAVAGGAPEPLPHPDTIEPWPISSVWPGDYIRSLDVRAVRAPEPGRATVWIGSDVELVAGEPVSELARWAMLLDTSNGIAVRQSPTEWMFPNVGLTVHLYRQPRGRWVGFDTTVVFGGSGHGLTSSVLHDEHGPVGRSEQILTVRPL